MMVPVLAGALGRWVAGALVVVLVGAAAGWYVRGRIAQAAEHRLQARIEQLQLAADRLADRAREWQRNYETLQRNNTTLERAIAEQNAALERLEAAHAQAEARRRAADQRLREYLARQPEQVVLVPGTCEAMVEQARKLGGGR